MDQSILIYGGAGGWLLALLAKGWMERVDKGRAAEVAKKFEELAKMLDEIEKECRTKVTDRDWKERRIETDRRAESLGLRLEKVEERLRTTVTWDDCKSMHKQAIDPKIEKMKGALIQHTHDPGGKADLKEYVL